VKITREEARRIASLAHLEFDDPGLDRMAADMTRILGYIDQLSGAPVSSPAMPGAGEDTGTPLRDDEVRPGVGREAIEANAPAFAGGFFVVPKVIE
jgi:aspartyl-tRNA(Asn)/glutamyl-tRNA(Gln) amidotransferase subunit C